MTSRDNHDPSLHKLITKALRILGRRQPVEEALAHQFAGLYVERDMLAADLHAGTETPAVVSRTLRAPAGTSRVVAVIHDGMYIKAALYSTGKRNPDREADVWRCIHDMAHKIREERRERG